MITKNSWVVCINTSGTGNSLGDELLTRNKRYKVMEVDGSFLILQGVKSCWHINRFVKTTPKLTLVQSK